jgi:hypothetical protein
VSSDVVKQMAVVMRERAAGLAPMKLALVASGAWDKARDLERGVEGSPLNTIVFNELMTACTWLGLNVDSARSILGELRADLGRIGRHD